MNQSSTPQWMYLGRIAASIALSAIIAFFWISNPKTKSRMTTSPNTFAMGSFLQGKLTERTLVVFWATWCQNCKEDLIKLKELKDNSPNKDFSVLAINADKPDLTDKARKLWAGTGFESEFISDSNGQWLNQLSIDALPTYFLFNKKGEALLRFDGQVNWGDEKVLKLIFE